MVPALKATIIQMSRETTDTEIHNISSDFTSQTSQNSPDVKEMERMLGIAGVIHSYLISSDAK